jgi:hypothetical protein
MKTGHTRHIALFLALTVLCIYFAACAGNTDGGQVTADTAGTAETEAPPDSLEARKLVDDNLPEADYEGVIFTILGDAKFTNYLTTEEQTGDVINDAIFSRNANVGERFNIGFDKLVYGESDTMNYAANSILADDDEFQLIANHIVCLGMRATNDYLINWYDMPRVDFSREWWSDSTTEDLTYQDKAFIAIGDFAVSAIGRAYCMFYNKALAADYNLPNVYEIVNGGGWTIDKLIELTADTYSDLNGDNKRDSDDFYGFSTDSKSNVNVYLWAFGKRICTRADDGTMEITYYDEKLVDIVNKVYDLLFQNDGCYTNSTTHNVGVDLFSRGNALFANAYFDKAISALRDFDDDFGIIPYPKWDTAQEKYQTMVDGDHEGLAVPITLRDTAYAGTIIEALCAEGWRTVIPAFYDVALKYKYTRDEESIAMLDTILDGRVFDFGYVYGGWGSAFWIQYLMEAQSNDIASHYAKNEQTYAEYMDKVFTYFDNYTG